MNYSKRKSINGKKEYDVEGESGLHGRKCRSWKEEYKLEGRVYEWEGRVLTLRKNKSGKEEYQLEGRVYEWEGRVLTIRKNKRGRKSTR